MPGHLNFKGIGEAVAIIKTKRKQKDPITLSVSEEVTEDGVDEIDLKTLGFGADAYLQIIPNSTSRDVLFACGGSKSGKTTYIKQFVVEYHKENPKNPVYLFSPGIEDPAFEEVKKYLKVVTLNDEFLSDPALLDVKNYKDCMCIFDDIEALPAKIKAKVNEIVAILMTAGRKPNCTVAIVNHCPNAGAATRLLHLENSHCIFFPHNLADKQLKYLCEDYLGLNKDYINKIIDWNCRGVCVVRTMPKVVIGKRNAFIVKRTRV